MKPIAATAIGIVLAATLAIAAPSDSPEDLANRVLAAASVEDMASTWKSWHPEAEHKIKVRIGLGQPDWDFSYRAADWANLPDWTEDPQVREAMKGYTETARSKPEITVKPGEEATTVTAITRVDYVWDNFSGSMKQTDTFEIVTQLNRPVIRSLTTEFDYR